MIAGTTHEYLVRLHEVILEEREFAKTLNMDSLVHAMREKEELIQILAHVSQLAEEDKEIAASLRHENRRNAYLYKATLGWIRETMEFFGQRTVSSSYSANAGMVNSNVNGRLISGEI